MTRHASLAIGIMVLVAVCARAQSTGPAGSEFRINQFTAGNQQSPVAVVEPSGTYLVVWASEGQDGSGLGVFGRRLDAGGAPLGDEFQVNQASSGNQADPAVTVDPAGRVTVVWSSAGQDGSGSGIFARQFSASGPLGLEFQVNSYTTGDQTVPRVAAGPGGFYVVWQSSGQDGSGNGVYGRLFTSDGQAASAEAPLPVQQVGEQVGPAVAALPNTWFVTGWIDNNAPPHAFGRFVDPAGAPAGSQFQTDGFQGTQFQERRHVVIAAEPSNEFVVAHWFHYAFVGDGVWQRDWATRLQRFDPTGAPQGPEFSTVPTLTNDGVRWEPAMGLTSTGSMLTAWTHAPIPYFCIPPCLSPTPPDGSGSAVFVRSFDESSTAISPQVRVNTTTAGDQSRPAVATDTWGNSLVAWQSADQDGSGTGIYAQRLGGLYPSGLTVDPAGNGVLDPGESVEVRPSWRNRNGASQAFGGALSGFTGPTGATYTVTDAAANYGTVADGGTQSCQIQNDCYDVSVSIPGPRPAQHVDASALEKLTPAVWGHRRALILHVGGSFADVPLASPYYRFVETLLHRSITTGCGGGAYCPAAPTTREQMSIFVLAARQGPGYAPPPCGAPLFADVPASNPFCGWIEELARRGAVSGCGGGNFCPSTAVTREQMSVFTLRTLDPALNPPACTTPVFADVPASSPFCRWIEELARRGVVNGCGGANYCPSAAVTREQMAVFLTGTFGLSLY